MLSFWFKMISFILEHFLATLVGWLNVRKDVSGCQDYNYHIDLNPSESEPNRKCTQDLDFIFILF